MEGIANSMFNLIKDLGMGSWQAVRNGDTSTFKKIWREYGKKGDIRHSNLLQGLNDLLIATIIMSIIRMACFDDPEVTGVSYNKQLKNSSAMFQNMY